MPSPTAGANDPLTAARVAYESGRFEEGLALARRILQRSPNNAQAHHIAALCQLQAGDAVRAEFGARRAIALDATRPDFFNTLGLTLAGQKKYDEALAAFERAAALVPDWAGPLANMGTMLMTQRKVRSAMRAFEAAAQRDPRHFTALKCLGIARRLCGQVETALEPLIRAMGVNNQEHELCEHVALAMNYAAGAQPAEVLAAHRHASGLAAGATLASLATVLEPTVSPGAADADRPLRIGYISPDLREHSVALFLEPLLAERDRATHAALLYSTGPKFDDTSRRLQALADSWADVAKDDDAALLRRLRADRLDVLIDLAGLTAGNRLSVFAARPAPLQGHAIGYPSTTGAPGMDFRVVDRWTDVPEADGWHSERLLRLDRCFLCYQPPANMPEPGASGLGEGDRPFTFGSFNFFMKIGPATARLWKRVLEQAPGSHLVLKTLGLEDEETREAFLENFAGVDPARIELLGWVKEKSEHARVYDRIDAALDPVPYCGTATTCEALWMGVPVVTLVGQRHVSRVGLSLLSAVGAGEAGGAGGNGATAEGGARCEEWIAHSEDEYVEKAAALARGGKRGVEQRRALRARVAASPLRDARGIARAFEGAIRGLWRERCGAAWRARA